MNETATAVKAKTLTAYQTNVLGTNRALKTECKTLGGALKLLWMFREEIQMGEKWSKIVHLIRNDKDVYHNFRQNCRVSKAGNYSPFYVLQAIHRMFKEADAQTKKEAKVEEKNLTPIDEKSVKELRAIAKKQGLKGYTKLKKAELITALTAK